MSVSSGKSVGASRGGSLLSRSSVSVRSVTPVTPAYFDDSDSARERAVHTFPSGTDAKSRVINRAKSNVNRGISHIRAILGIHATIVALLSEMETLAREAAEESSTKKQRRKSSKKFAKIDKQIRDLIAGGDEVVSELLPGASLLAGNKVAIMPALNDRRGKPHVSADGRYITYTTRDGKVYQDDLETEQRALLSGDGLSEFDPAANAGGDLVVFERSGELFLYDRTLNKTKSLMESSDEKIIDRFVMSADGSTLVLSMVVKKEEEDEEKRNLIVFSLEEKKERVIELSFDSSISHISLSPNGSKAALCSYVGGEEKIFVVDCESKDEANSTIPVQSGDQHPPERQQKPPARKRKADQAFPQDSGISKGGGFSKLVGVSDDGRLYVIRGPIGKNRKGSESQLLEYSVETGSFRRIKSAEGTYTVEEVIPNNDGSSLFLIGSKDEEEGVPGTGQQLFRIDIESCKVRQLTDKSGGLDIKTTFPAAIAADGSTIVYEEISGALVKLNLGGGAGTIEVEAGTTQQRRFTKMIYAIQSIVKGLGGFVLTSKRAANNALSRVKKDSEEIERTINELLAALPELQELYLTLREEAFDQKISGGQLSNEEEAERVAKRLAGEIFLNKKDALGAHSSIDGEIAMKLLDSQS